MIRLLQHISILCLLLTCLDAHAQKIAMRLGGAKFVPSGGQLAVSITVDTSLPTVISGSQADQTFRDDTVSAAFFGYFITLGVGSSQQSTFNSLKVAVKVGSGETSGRTYALYGHGATNPSSQSDLIRPPNSYAAFLTRNVNNAFCGVNWMTHIPGSVICEGATLVPTLDLTQFVKVLYSDSTASTFTSQLDFIAVVN